jgi:hypothetical protein
MPSASGSLFSGLGLREFFSEFIASVPIVVTESNDIEAWQRLIRVAAIETALAGIDIEL